MSNFYLKPKTEILKVLKEEFSDAPLESYLFLLEMLMTGIKSYYFLILDKRTQLEEFLNVVYRLREEEFIKHFFIDKELDKGKYLEILPITGGSAGFWETKNLDGIDAQIQITESQFFNMCSTEMKYLL
jgi:hypothetical protein